MRSQQTSSSTFLYNLQRQRSLLSKFTGLATSLSVWSISSICAPQNDPELPTSLPDRIQLTVVLHSPSTSPSSHEACLDPIKSNTVNTGTHAQQLCCLLAVSHQGLARASLKQVKKLRPLNIPPSRLSDMLTGLFGFY